MTGTVAAAPIWAEFMKRAVALPQYSDTKNFSPPEGVVEVRLDKQTNLLSDAACPDSYFASFLDGTQPTDTCDNANGDQRNVFQKIFGLGQSPTPQQAVPGSQPQAVPPAAQPGGSTAASGPQPAAPTQQQPAKKPGFFGRLFGQKPKPPDPQTTDPPQQ
jgi:penicillin-binding protein 1B